jgi:hypothetical protein
VLLPPFLLIDDDYADTQAFIALVKRIGLVNKVRSLGTVAEAKRFLATAEQPALPVVIFIGDAAPEEDGDELFEWLGSQAVTLGAIPTVMLAKPLEMYAVIRALKELSLPERARIDATTLTVRVELWPRGTILTDG